MALAAAFPTVGLVEAGATALPRFQWLLFTAPFLERFASLAPGRLEGEEALEQLRALENGVRIRVAETAYRGFGIDTPEDLERARALVAGAR